MLGHLECVSGAEGVTEAGGKYYDLLSTDKHLECVSGAEGAAESSVND